MLTRDKFRGCIIGQAVGDALGMPVERQSPQVCQDYVKTLHSSMGAVRHALYAFGQYTDDSQLMRELVLSFVACEDFDPTDYACRIAKLYATVQIVGSSSASTKVAARLSSGVPWQEAGTPAPYARNGGAMRAAPIGLFFSNDPERLIQAACDQAQITHQDKRVSAGAVAIAGAVSLAVQCEEIRPSEFLKQLSAWVEQVEPSSRDGAGNLFAADLLQLVDWVDLPINEALEQVMPMGSPPDSLKDWEGISPWVVPSVLWSLYSFLHSQNDYWQTACTAISGGGDADTTAAMAGAISGAFLGLDPIPTNVAHRLTDQGKWGYEPLLALSDLGFHLARVRQMMNDKTILSQVAAAVV